MQQQRNADKYHWLVFVGQFKISAAMFAAIIVRNNRGIPSEEDFLTSNNPKSNSSTPNQCEENPRLCLSPTPRLMSGSDLLPEEEGDRRLLLRSDPLSATPSPSPSTSVPGVANPSNLGTPRGVLSRLHVDRQTSPEPVTETNGATPRTVLRLSSAGLTRRSLHVESPRVEPNVNAGSPRSVVTDELADGAPPEWALLLIGCLLGLATGVCVAAFNRGVRFFFLSCVDLSLL